MNKVQSWCIYILFYSKGPLGTRPTALPLVGVKQIFYVIPFIITVTDGYSFQILCHRKIKRGHIPQEVLTFQKQLEILGMPMATVRRIQSVAYTLLLRNAMFGSATIFKEYHLLDIQNMLQVLCY